MKRYVPGNIKELLEMKIPTPISRIMSCYVFYDHHPLDETELDVIVCTSNGEIIELNQREIKHSALLGVSLAKPQNLILMRTNKCNLFYLVASGTILSIVERSDKKLIVRNIIPEVANYIIEDLQCTGDPILKIWKNDDSPPLVVNSDMNVLRHHQLQESLDSKENYVVLTNLMSQLTAAKFTVKSNEKIGKDFLSARQTAAFGIYQRTHPNGDGSIFLNEIDKGPCPMSPGVHIKKLIPWVKICNNQLVLIFKVLHSKSESIKNVTVLIHGTNQRSMSYASKIFERSSTPPYFIETSSNNIKANSETPLVVIMKLGEIQRNVTENLELSGVITYLYKDTEFIVPFEKFNQSSLGLTSDKFDVLASDIIDDDLLLAIIATSKQKKLLIRYMQNENQPRFINFTETVCTHLLMEPVLTSSLIIHKQSPYHPLNGMMLLHTNAQETSTCYKVTTFLRSSSQLINFIQLINDTFPYRLVITTDQYRLKAKTDDLQRFDEEIRMPCIPASDHTASAKAMIKQANLALEYLDKCMLAMEISAGSSKDMIGKTIDLYAKVDELADYREKIMKEFV